MISRRFSSGRSISSRIPPPTWSLRDLNLKSIQGRQQPTIKDEELNTLAERCLLDVKNLTQSERDELKIELGNMMRCISLVSEKSAGGGSTGEDQLTEEEMYDLSRGFIGKSTPVRGNEEELGAWSKSGSHESDVILNKLKHKTVRIENDVGQEEVFFSISTSEASRDAQR